MPSPTTTAVAAGAFAAFGIAAWWIMSRRKGEAPSATGGSGAPKTADARRLCVFCGSSMPSSPAGDAIVREARELGRLLAERGIELVYGGGGVGVMGEVARAVDEAGGVVRGIIPAALAPKEVSSEGVQPENVEVVATMHQRKRRMAELATEGFIALPGGFGTHEELLEMVTWTQLGIHHKSVGVLNVAEFYAPLLQFFRGAADAGFIKHKYLDIVVTETSAQALLDKVTTHATPKGYALDWGPDATASS